MLLPAETTTTTTTTLINCNNSEKTSNESSPSNNAEPKKGVRRKRKKAEAEDREENDPEHLRKGKKKSRDGTNNDRTLFTLPPPLPVPPLSDSSSTAPTLTNTHDVTPQSLVRDLNAPSLSPRVSNAKSLDREAGDRLDSPLLLQALRRYARDNRRRLREDCPDVERSMQDEEELVDGEDGRDVTVKSVPPRSTRALGILNSAAHYPDEEDVESADDMKKKLLSGHEIIAEVEAEIQTETRGVRWVVLFLSCLLLFGNYYAYDNPAALNLSLQHYLGLPYHQFQFLLNLLYSVYSLPNSILPFFSGALIDRLGVSRVLLSLSAAVLFGQTAFSIGLSAKSIPMMIFGRVIFGIGGESISVAQASITTRWFRGKELAFALGMNLSISRLGSVANAIITPWVTTGGIGNSDPDGSSVPAAVWIGTCTCLASSFAAVLLVWVVGVDPAAKAAANRRILASSRCSESSTANFSHVSDGPQCRPNGNGYPIHKSDSTEIEDGRIDGTHLLSHSPDTYQNDVKTDSLGGALTAEPETFGNEFIHRENNRTENQRASRLVPWWLRRQGQKLRGSGSRREFNDFGAGTHGSQSSWHRPTYGACEQVHVDVDGRGEESDIFDDEFAENMGTEQSQPAPALDCSQTERYSLQSSRSRRRSISPPSSVSPLLPARNGSSLKPQSRRSPLYTNLSELGLEFWILCSVCFTLYGTVVPFNNIVSDLMQSRWFPGDPRTAGAVMSIPDTLSAFLVPFAGYMVDRHGKRAALLVICGVCITGVHLTLGCTDLFPVIPMLVLGVSYSIYGVSIWPSIACLIHEENHLGLAYGICTSTLNISLTVIPIVVATIRVNSDSFVPVELFFACLAAAGALLAAILWRVDVRSGGRLQQPEISVNATIMATDSTSVDEVEILRDGGDEERFAGDRLSESARYPKLDRRTLTRVLNRESLPGTPGSYASSSGNHPSRLQRYYTLPNSRYLAMSSSSSLSISSTSVASELLPIICNPLRGSSGSFSFSRQSLTLDRTNTYPHAPVRGRRTSHVYTLASSNASARQSAGSLPRNGTGNGGNNANLVANSARHDTHHHDQNSMPPPLPTGGIESQVVGSRRFQSRRSSGYGSIVGPQENAEETELG